MEINFFMYLCYKIFEVCVDVSTDNLVLVCFSAMRSKWNLRPVAEDLESS